ncbi:MAG: HDIG domain-containing metalloprotein [Candidatus Omnitrophota bacterium]
MIKQTTVNKSRTFQNTPQQAAGMNGRKGGDKIELLITTVIFVFLTSIILGINLIISLLLIVLFLFFRYSYPDAHQQKHSFLNSALLLALIFVISYFIVRHGLSAYYIPFSVIPMLATILFRDLNLAMLITVASALTISSIANNNYYLGILFLISGTVSIILVKQIHKRDNIFRAGAVIGLVQLIALFFNQKFQIADWMNYVILLCNGIASGIIVIGVLPVFEYLFSITTNISLLELFHHPLLERLKTEIPGTHHHSLVVGNLSEAACTAIGANALLARIGAYYHDIGKLSKPEYFSENQNDTVNKHDILSPTISKMIIMNHVKEGVELAKKHKLNSVLIDFIQQHHGSSLVYYFYRRALENSENSQEIIEEGFRYPGPKPNKKETAIVLLADSVEAATRTLKEPTPAKIEETVHKIINNKFIDGQLDECELTLKDLERISSVFIRILTGIYHTRVTYPEKPAE